MSISDYIDRLDQLNKSLERNAKLEKVAQAARAFLTLTDEPSKELEYIHAIIALQGALKSLEDSEERDV